MKRLQSVKDKLSEEWLDNKNARTQHLQKYIGNVFDKNVEKELQCYCTPFINVEICKNRETFEVLRQVSSTHVLHNSDVWILCLLNESNIILDIDYSMG